MLPSGLHAPMPQGLFTASPRHLKCLALAWFEQAPVVKITQVPVSVCSHGC